MTITTESKAAALAEYLGCDVDEIEETRHTTNLFEVIGGKAEYLVLKDDEADEMAAEYIKSSLWAFNAEFICSHIDNRVGDPIIDALKEMQKKLCEDSNSLIANMIDDMDEFVDDAICADGRGHFLAPYDFEEIESGGYYIYRVN